MSVRTLRYSTIEQHFTKGVTASTDRDALAFLEAATIYNTNQQRAIIQLVRGLKRTGLWSKMKAIYPFVGGTATTHKWNLKDPRDLDAAFRLTFSGGWTHSSTGALPNGTNAYGRTYLKPETNLTYLSWGLSYYSRTDDNTTVQAELRCFTVSPFGSLMLRAARSYLGVDFPDINFTTQNDSRGFWIGTTRSATHRELYRNGISEITETSNRIGTAPNIDMFIGAGNQDSTGATLFSKKECAFATIGDGLTDTDATNLYNIVDLYQKRLGRAV